MPFGRIDGNSNLCSGFPVIIKDFFYNSGEGVKSNDLITVDEMTVALGKPEDDSYYGWDNEYGSKTLRYGCTSDNPDYLHRQQNPHRSKSWSQGWF